MEIVVSAPRLLGLHDANNSSWEMFLPIDRLQLRRVFGRFATGVTIVASRFGSEVHGMTANSFSSVSLDPPLLLVCLANQSHTLLVIERSATFGLSVLGSEQRDIAETFSRPGGKKIFCMTDFFGVPVISGALAHFCCELEAKHLAGDHTIVVGEIKACELQEGPPLIFHSGAYANLDIMISS